MLYQPTNIMLNFLRKAQEAQTKLALLNEGFSLHVELNSNADTFSASGGYHINIEVTLFEENSLVQSWDFYATMDKEELAHTLSDLEFHIDRL